MINRSYEEEQHEKREKKELVWECDEAGKRSNEKSDTSDVMNAHAVQRASESRQRRFDKERKRIKLSFIKKQCAQWNVW